MLYKEVSDVRMEDRDIYSCKAWAAHMTFAILMVEEDSSSLSLQLPFLASPDRKLDSHAKRIPGGAEVCAKELQPRFSNLNIVRMNIACFSKATVDSYMYYPNA